MSNMFFTADLHLGHKKICGFQPKERPFDSVEEHDEKIIDNWNSVIRKQDVVYVLGDVAFGSEGLKKVSRLRGIKKLILGNHDNYPMARYLELFTSVHAVKQMKDRWVLTHIPLHPDSVDRWKFNIHGHLHSKRVTRRMVIPDFGVDQECYDFRYLCVSLEQNGMFPMSIEEVRLRLNHCI